MRRFTLFMLCCAALTTAAFSQTTVIDSIQTGAGYANDVFYSLKNGQLKSEANSDWQLAFGIGFQNVSIRSNTKTTSTGNGSITVYEHPVLGTAAWTNFDTTGYTSWSVGNNSDANWEDGAFNRHPAGHPDYDWGLYDDNTHVISGQKLYLLSINNSGTTVFKKLWILDKTLGVWHVKYADIDGSNEQIIEIKSSDYAGKNFAYLSVLTNQVIDREPSADWDFIYTRYAASDVGYMATTGILTNNGVVTARIKGMDPATTTLADTTYTSDTISMIGYDWKKFNNSTFLYEIVTDRSYFVQARDGAFWKLVFTEFRSSVGHTAFGKTKLTLATAIGDVKGHSLKASVYPNPASAVLTVLVDAKNPATNVTITDLTGKVVLQKDFTSNGFQGQNIDVQDLKRGMYFVTITNGSDRAVQKLLLN